MRKFEEVINAKMEEAINDHAKLEVANDVLEMLLYQARKNMDIQPFVDIDNRPKHLLHLTEEDVRVKSPEELRFELDNLIKEAKSKIVPVNMSLEEREYYITSEE